MVFGISYADDLRKAKELLQQIVAVHVQNSAAQAANDNNDVPADGGQPASKKVLM